MPKIHRLRAPTSRFDIVAQVPPRAPEPEVPPPRSALKSVWVAYAKSLGVDATGTKGQIIARVTNG
jgi:hypothetical protein